ncbi:glycoside hydrolase domain-containing protein [Streptomyces mangrovisoli]|uniref:glycoside hydrolase domain-containing protein n=1 Tax=Streptomyces mangrovisoli TaxID=1428628 RepID=UPI0009A0DD79|nr:glycoside hydrolase domain-containing protein [Streptomyces mangrovisoli]
MPHPRAVSRRLLAVSSALVLIKSTVLALAPGAAAEPATPVAYPPGATATRFTGLAFDACTAPPAATLDAWRASSYRALAVYVSGANRTCRQPELTSSWVTKVSRLGWRLLPVHKGLQPPCGARPSDTKISRTPATARAQGTAAARQATDQAKTLGMLPGSALYNDIENYSQTDSGCRTAVLSYLSAWTKELHRTGYVSGVYMNLTLGARQLAAAYASTTYARPDALWIARYDDASSLTGWSGITDNAWAVHQRAKQYRGSHDERHGGVTVNVDSDRVDAPVATVAYPYTATGTDRAQARGGPSADAPVTTSYAAGAALRVVCQTPGSTVATTPVWDRLADGSYVSDHYVSTPSATGYSAPLPRCAQPFQVTAAHGLTERTGPGSGYAAAGSLPQGALAWVTCQRSGAKVRANTVWDRLDDGRYVTDQYVATPAAGAYSPPLPRC